MAGEPCAPGSPVVVLDGPLDHFGYPPVLQCTGPAGCEGDAGFRWVAGGRGSYFYCGCDGTTRTTDPDFGGPPTFRWRWYGSCEGPCAGILFDGDEWVVPYYVGLPAAPQCIPDCTRAIQQEEACVDAEGATMPRECCDCTGAALDESGQCTHGAYGFPVPAFCCEA
jgi:hypothetical protein